MKLRYIFLVICFFILKAITISAQQRLTFRVADFHQNPLDLTARNDQFKRMDDNGALYSIIKVTSDLPDDELKSYVFDFGLMNSFTEIHQDDGELWVYVQKNAKTVTIRREGYATISKYDLGTTIAAGATYEMRLSVQAAAVLMQMVMFRVKPATAKAFIVVKLEQPGAVDEALGMVDETGAVAKSLPFGSYTYRVAAENYYPSEGRFTLNNQAENHVEDVTLRGNFGNITLNVESDADIYVDGEKKGTRTWTGALKAGSHQVECRQANHKPTSQAIAVAENETRTIALTPPVPITGTLSVTSRPLGAKITIDGKDYGETPKNITGLLVGKHTVELSGSGNRGGKQDVEIQENQTAVIDMELAQRDNYAKVDGDAQVFTVTGYGKTVSFKMIKVEAGTFQMGSEFGDSDEIPVHQVTLTKDYFVGETEVTNALWYAVMGKVPSKSNKGDSFPVESVSYKDCQKFIERLSKLVYQRFRLPTEAEWEFAAKGGKKSQGYIYAGSNAIGEVAWYTDNSGSKTHEVKTKKANELGLYDMSGNVWEWCADWYSSYNNGAQTDPTGPTSGSGRVIRGGSWYRAATYCRVANRFNNSQWIRGNGLGFRLAL